MKSEQVDLPQIHWAHVDSDLLQFSQCHRIYLPVNIHLPSREMVAGIDTLSTGQRFRIKLSRLNPAHLAGFYQDRLAAGLAPASVNKLHVTLHKALGQAVKWNMIPRNICEAVNPPRPAPEEMRTLCAQEMRRLLEAARGDRLEALYVLAVHTGMRQGELL